MSDMLQISFDSLDSAMEGVGVVLVEDKPVFPPVAARIDRKAKGLLRRAAKAGGFKGTSKTNAEILASGEVGLDRLVLIGAGEAEKLDDRGLNDLGGYLLGQLQSRKITDAHCVLELKNKALDSNAVGEIALGMLLRAYAFNKYKHQNSTRSPKNGTKPRRIVIHCKSPAAAEKAYARVRAVAEGVCLARDLVNEPANRLGPEEFAARARALTDLGVEVDILDESELENENMQALLAVGHGSARRPRVAVMRWNGAASKRAKPVAFVGKGVVFDTGGISLKPAKGMEDMKGDMGGAACVTGLMHTLATRKAKLNAVGIIGLVENMPSDRATRPGDVIGSRAGKSIEVVNTDAEGRLVLADLIDYVQDKYAPKAMVDLATLTGAIMVALGQDYAGLFSNNDRLAGRLATAGTATGERVWRMPLDEEYDKQLESKFADLRNIGGRFAGSITAAQFLQRFVKDTPWAHIDIAGTAMASKQTETNPSWGSGFGVRLLDRLVADAYEG